MTRQVHEKHANLPSSEKYQLRHGYAAVVTVGSKKQ